MKIAKVTVLAFSRQLDGRAWNPVFRWHERRAPLLLIEMASGEVGVGEGWSQYTNCEAVLALLAEQVAPRLIGRCIESPRDAAAALMQEISSDMPWAVSAAVSAVDIALWDAVAKGQRLPLWRYLGGVSESAPVYASGGLYRDTYSLDDLRTEFRAYRNAGFTAYKMKIAGLTLQEDLARVSAVRETIGDSATLWVDAVNQLSDGSVETWTKALAAFKPAAIQAPVGTDDVQTMSRINETMLPVIGNEGEFRFSAFEGLVNTKAVGYLQYCLPLCGGFSGGISLDDLALRAQLRSTPQCFSTAIAQAATLHFAAARQNVISAEFHCYHDHLQFLYRDGCAEIRIGYASAGHGAGLGVAIPQLGVQQDGSVITLYREVAR
ncbi:mandelate racemase/muconate lactonizing enzyme family protein [Robbsia andropogonis]|uniref:mandelate racemase/muconate lactonizing enzyme family protein n=1 Tax=Robbsia andropogonis TaxID=28092 RepID=UPI002A699AB6|nr:mandelate racemase/muconate lactonizing enzyme family protein [Robbsia andropogonis]